MKVLASRDERRRRKARRRYEEEKARAQGDEDAVLTIRERAERAFFFWTAGPGGGP